MAESVELLRRGEASDLGADTLDQLEELVDRRGYDYFAMPPAAFRGTLLSWRRYVTRLLDGRVTLAHRRRLYAVAGWLSGLLVEVSLALGEEAAPHCVTALSLAREIGDPRLAGRVLGNRVQIALYTRDPLHSVAFARTGGRSLHEDRRPSAAHALTTNGLATGSAEIAPWPAEQAWSMLAQPPTRCIYSGAQQEV